MELKKILEVVTLYRKQLEEKNIPKKRMDISKTFGEVSSKDRLAHAHWLLDGIVEYANQKNKEGKTGRHLTSVQMILSFENWYTLKELMYHNRPDTY
ncbi:hypothetical protein COB87_000850 [Candidatus Wolfebacteria bacterium]|nr:hypothetical protein [Candidatus Wolfebacteria bacterium]